MFVLFSFVYCNFAFEVIVCVCVYMRKSERISSFFKAELSDRQAEEEERERERGREEKEV